MFQFVTLYEDLLELCNSVSIHQSTCDFGLWKYIKTHFNLNSEFMWSVFKNRRFQIIS